jgi:hypothetical protein
MRFPALAMGLLALLTASSCVSTRRVVALEQRVTDIESRAQTSATDLDDLRNRLATATADSDNDGVIDSRDQEPRTPSDVDVDRFGRTIIPPKPAPVMPQPEPITGGRVEEPEPVNRPTDTDMGENFHEVARGDTLFSIARRYGISVAAIREMNNLRSDHIEVGQRLRIR